MAADVKKKERVVDDTVPYADLLLLDEEPIGAGAFGAVYVAIHKEWGCKVAYKKLGIQFIRGTTKAEKQLVQGLTYEAEIHRQLRHPNIVSMLGIVFESGNYGIVLEFVTYGSLNNFMSTLTDEDSDTSCVPWILKLKHLLEICIGMSYLHKHDILHCDLKLSNILIGDNVNAKISDFGLAKWKNFSRSKTNAGHICGTLSHMPPEKLKDMNYREDDKCDVYSFSILCWELFTEKEAYMGKEASIIRMWVTSGDRLPLNCLPPEVPETVHTLIESCWDQDASNRPSFAVVKDKLNSLICYPTNESLLKVAKEKVVLTLHKLSTPEICADHVRELRQFQLQLCEFLRRTDQILSALRETRHITQQEYELICSQPTEYETINLLINTLCEKPVSAYQTFLDALLSTNQQYVVFLLKDKDYQLSSAHKSILLDNITYLKKNIVLSDTSILDHLLEEDVLDNHEVEKIKSKDTNNDKVQQLLHYIMRTSHDQYQLFLESLNKADHEFVYNKLMGTTNKTLKNNQKFDYTKFLGKLALLHVMPGHGQSIITGITVLGSEVFVIRNSSLVKVYKSDDFTCIRNLTITGSKQLTGLLSCSHYNCLYACDGDQKIIYRYDLTNNVTTNWSVAGQCYRLSLTKSYNILATLCDSSRRIQEYTTHGSLVRVISLDSSIDNPRHSVQLSTGNFVVCHLGAQHQRVCIVDQSGRIILSYEGLPVRCEELTFYPRHLAVDIHDNVLVADHDNNRVQLLSPTLTYLGDIVIPGHIPVLNRPLALHVDELNHRLFIGEGEGRRMFVLREDRRRQ